MKTFIPIVTLTVALSSFCANAADGQQSSSAPAPENLPVNGKELAAAQAEADQQFDQARQQFEAARQEMDQTRQELKRLQAAVAGGGGGGGGTGVAPGSPAGSFTERVQTFLRRASGDGDNAGKVLVIRSTEAEPGTQANLEEDLAVMSHLLDKTLEEKLGGPQTGRRAMGIDVVFVPGAGPVRSMYLDGYGALFMLNVGFPLVPPPSEPESQEQKPPADSAWEQARRELYGRPDEPKGFAPPVEDYSEDKANKLKDALLEALKNAANIRNLKSDDSITVCVFGGVGAAPTGAFARPPKPPTIPTRTVRLPSAGADPVVTLSRINADDSAPMRGTILTIRVKKSDVDAFAREKLNLDEFRRKATITAYAGNAGAMGGTDAWVGFGARR